MSRVLGKRRTVEEWKSVLMRYEASGQGRQAFCRREGLAGTTFDKWRRKIRSLDAQPTFVEMTPEPASSGWDLEVTLPTGVVLRFRG